MTVTRRGFMAGAAALAASGWPRRAAGQSATKVKFTLPWIPHGGYTHIFAAKKLGFWEKRGLDVSVDRGFGSGEVCKTIGLGQYEFGEIDYGVMVTQSVSDNLASEFAGLTGPDLFRKLYSDPDLGTLILDQVYTEQQKKENFTKGSTGS